MGIYRLTRSIILLSLFFLFMIFPSTALSDCIDELDDLVGYTIVDSKTITGWYDDDEKEEGSFNGCSHGRAIRFSDGTRLICAEYGYMYAYRPTAIILAREILFKGKKLYDIKMMVEDEIYDMRR